MNLKHKNTYYLIMSTKFKRGDIVCQHQRYGSEDWYQVSEIIDVDPNNYQVRHIQFRTNNSNWSTHQNIMGNYISRKSWQEKQTKLFTEKTLEQIEHDKEERVRQIVREELPKQSQSTNGNLEKLFVTKSGYDHSSNVEFVKKILVMEESELNGMGYGETFVTIDYDRFVQLLQTVDHLVCKVDSLTKRVEQLEKQK